MKNEKNDEENSSRRPRLRRKKVKYQLKTEVREIKYSYIQDEIGINVHFDLANYDSDRMVAYTIVITELLRILKFQRETLPTEGVAAIQGTLEVLRGFLDSLTLKIESDVGYRDKVEILRELMQKMAQSEGNEKNSEEPNDIHL